MNKILIILLGITVLASVGTLSTQSGPIMLFLQNIGILGIADLAMFGCECAGPGGPSRENCMGFDGTMFSDPNGLCTWELDMSEYGDPRTYEEGCSADYWMTHSWIGSKKYSWPEGINPYDYYNEKFSTNIVMPSEKDDDGPTLIKALHAKGEGMNKLMPESVTALLNAAHPDMDYPYSPEEVISMTQSAIDNEEYVDMITEFKDYRSNGKSSLCSD